ncbi:hypothetical protein [Neobacillus bataviensis]|uniref:hypothetical protein n=1 Tax=Neobacillus bataviensis TaxID=220685 RepID=UPI001CBCE781|nr:hypothetical protein [Neobacillus bataviensis]
MDLGVIIVWLSLTIYVFIIHKAKIIDKKERKWVYLLVLVAIGCSLLVEFDVSLNSATSFLNNTFGRLSRMVVKI